jgi:hypothetical protein
MTAGDRLLVAETQQNAAQPSDDAGRLRDITGIERQEPFPSRPWPLYLAIAITLLSILLLIAWRLRRGAREATPQYSVRRALEELDRIEAMDLPATGQVEQFHSLLCEVLRVHLEARFALRVSRQTTREFLEAIDRSALLATPQQAHVREILERCDLAKFGRAAFSVQECREILLKARTLVVETSEEELNLL